MTDQSILPWQQSIWTSLTDLAARGRLPHGLLFAGGQHIGKSMFATGFVKYLLCKSPGETSCGICVTCQLSAAGTHPDFKLVTLEDSKQIKIEQVRDLLDWSYQTANQGGRKVALISPAETMNIQASNALLKCLEEPPGDTVIILLTHQPARLLPTIRSRCRLVTFAMPLLEEAAKWLEQQPASDRGERDPALLLAIANGAPLKVVNEFDEEFLAIRDLLTRELVPLASGSKSSIEIAARLIKVSKASPVRVLDLMYDLVADSLRLTFTGGQAPLQNSDVEVVIRQFGESMCVADRFALLDRITRARRLMDGTTNPNPQMLFEWVLQPSVR